MECQFEGRGQSLGGWFEPLLIVQNCNSGDATFTCRLVVVHVKYTTVGWEKPDSLASMVATVTAGLDRVGCRLECEG